MLFFIQSKRKQKDGAKKEGVLEVADEGGVGGVREREREFSQKVISLFLHYNYVAFYLPHE